MPKTKLKIRSDQPETLETKRARLRKNLAASSDIALCAEEWQRQELDEVDPAIEPSLNFMAFMGVSRNEVFQSIFEQLKMQFQKELRTISLDSSKPEELLQEMLPHAADPDFQELVNALLDRFPKVTHMRAQRFLNDMEPIVADLLWSFHKRTGRLMMDLKRQSPKQRRDEDPALQSLAKLIGGHRDLYQEACKELRKRFISTIDSGRPAARLRAQSSGKQGPPVSVGPDAFLSTIRSQLFLVMRDQGFVSESVVGKWIITSLVGGVHPVTYNIQIERVDQQGNLKGTSDLRTGAQRVERLEGRITGSHLQFTQFYATGSYVCECVIHSDKQQLVNGHWTGANLSGTFTAQRVGFARLMDAEGQIWDNSGELIVALDALHQRPYAIDDTTCKELKRLFRSSKDLLEPEDTLFVLMDPCVSTTIIRGLLKTSFRSLQEKTSSCSEGSEPERYAFQLLQAAQTLHATLLSGGNVSQLDLTELALDGCGPGNSSFPYELLATALRKHSVKKFEPSDIEVLNSELKEALGVAAKSSYSTVCTIRLVLNALINKYMMVPGQDCSTQGPLVNTLPLVKVAADIAAVGASALAHSSNTTLSVDWITRYFVDIMVGVATDQRRKIYTDKELRERICEYLFPLSQDDAWVHHRYIDFLSVYRDEQFASSREEIEIFQDILKGGCLQDAHYNWEQDFVVEYKKIVEGKPYLESILRSSRLGRLLRISP